MGTLENSLKMDDLSPRRLLQFAKLFMYNPSAGLYTCPLAMTDGAASTFEEHNFIKQTGGRQWRK